MIDPTVLRRFVEANCTEREIEAARLVFGQRLGIGGAARELGVTRPAVRCRLDSILRKVTVPGYRP